MTKPTLISSYFLCVKWQNRRWSLIFSLCLMTKPSLISSHFLCVKWRNLRWSLIFSMLNDVIYVDLLYCLRFSMFNDANLRWFPHIFSVLNDKTDVDLLLFFLFLMTTSTLILSSVLYVKWRHLRWWSYWLDWLLFAWVELFFSHNCVLSKTETVEQGIT